MGNVDITGMKKRVIRRIIVKTVVLALWTASLVWIMMTGNEELRQSTYLYMVIAIAAIWVLSTVRDVRRLNDEEALRKATIAENDERNILLSYKATRLSVTIVLCLLPIVICVLAYNGMQAAIDAIGFAVCGFLIIYLLSWYYVSQKN